MTESQRYVVFVRPAREKGAFVLGLSDPEERYTVGQALYHEIGEVRGGDALSGTVSDVGVFAAFFKKRVF